MCCWLQEGALANFVWRERCGQGVVLGLWRLVDLGGVFSVFLLFSEFGGQGVCHEDVFFGRGAVLYKLEVVFGAFPKTFSVTILSSLSPIAKMVILDMRFFENSDIEAVCMRFNANRLYFRCLSHSLGYISIGFGTIVRTSLCLLVRSTENPEASFRKCISDSFKLPLFTGFRRSGVLPGEIERTWELEGA